jgi:hypothetical protein
MKHVKLYESWLDDWTAGDSEMVSLGLGSGNPFDLIKAAAPAVIKIANTYKNLVGRPDWIEVMGKHPETSWIKQVCDTPGVKKLLQAGLVLISKPVQLANANLVFAKPGMLDRYDNYAIGIFLATAKIRRMPPTRFKHQDVTVKQFDGYQPLEFFNTAADWIVTNIDLTSRDFASNKTVAAAAKKIEVKDQAFQFVRDLFTSRGINRTDDQIKALPTELAYNNAAGELKKFMAEVKRLNRTSSQLILPIRYTGSPLNQDQINNMSDLALAWVGSHIFFGEVTDLSNFNFITNAPGYEIESASVSNSLPLKEIIRPDLPLVRFAIYGWDNPDFHVELTTKNFTIGRTRVSPKRITLDLAGHSQGSIDLSAGVEDLSIFSEVGSNLTIKFQSPFPEIKLNGEAVDTSVASQGYSNFYLNLVV